MSAAAQIQWCADAQEFARRAADVVGACLSRKPHAVLAIPTGQTPLGLYAELVRRVAARQLDLSQTRCFNLDDYVGLNPDHPLSYARFLRERFLAPAEIRPAHARLLDGAAPDLEAECRACEAAIRDAGGLDLAILGLGPNGHIGFNEPGSEWTVRTHVVALSQQTRSMHAKQTQDRFPIPAFGITLGVASIFAARQILLLVSGDSKARALATYRRGIPDPRWPVTALLTHPDVIVLSDAALATSSAPGRTPVVE
jgi:glucosamine-6-phosphate deaminase